MLTNSYYYSIVAIDCMSPQSIGGIGRRNHAKQRSRTEIQGRYGPETGAHADHDDQRDRQVSGCARNDGLSLAQKGHPAGIQDRRTVAFEKRSIGRVPRPEDGKVTPARKSADG